jgi:cob(I)alamin adenosyltransferase
MTAKGTLLSGEYDMVVLDELNVVLAAGLIELDQVFKVLSDRSPNTEVVITGRGAPRELVKRADLVTEMLAIKHYYQEGIAGREGIEW